MLSFRLDALIFSIFLCSLLSEDALRHVVLLWRHGDRAPYAASPETAARWEDGFGQLTQIGIKQHFELGQYLREEYKTFIPDNYNFKYYHVRSSDYDRTLMSAQANAAGFFTNSTTPLPYGWRPIPVHTVKKEHEHLFFTYECKRLRELLEAGYKTKEAKDFIKKHEKTVNYVERNIGHRPSPYEMAQLTDQLVCDKHHGFDFPKWIDEDTYKDLLVITEYFWSVNFSGDEKLAFEGGVFMFNLMKHINELVINGTSTINIDGSSRQLAKNHIMAYSGHDTTVAAIMSIFGVPVPMPGYAATVQIELYGPEFPNPPDKYHFIIKYKESYEKAKGTPIKLPFCDNEKCPLVKLFEHLKKYSIDGSLYQDKCEGKHPPIEPTYSTGIYIAIAICIICIVIPAVLAIVYQFYKRRKGYTIVSGNSM